MVGEPVDQPEQASDHKRYADQHGRDGQRRVRPDQQHQADDQAAEPGGEKRGPGTAREVRAERPGSWLAGWVSRRGSRASPHGSLAWRGRVAGHRGLAVGSRLIMRGWLALHGRWTWLARTWTA